MNKGHNHVKLINLTNKKSWIEIKTLKPIPPFD